MVSYKFPIIHIVNHNKNFIFRLEYVTFYNKRGRSDRNTTNKAVLFENAKIVDRLLIKHLSYFKLERKKEMSSLEMRSIIL